MKTELYYIALYVAAVLLTATIVHLLDLSRETVLVWAPGAITGVTLLFVIHATGRLNLRIEEIDD